MRIAAAIQLGFLKMTGCPLDDLSSPPQSVLKPVWSQLGAGRVEIATLRGIYERPKNRFDHQWWIMELLRKPDAQALAPLPSFLENEARLTTDRDALVQRAKNLLYQHQ